MYKDIKEMFVAYIDAEEQETTLSSIVGIHQDGIDKEIAKIDGSDVDAADRIMEGFLTCKPVIYNTTKSRAVNYEDAPEFLRTCYDHFIEDSEKLAKVKSRLVDIRSCFTHTEDGKTVYCPRKDVIE